MYKVYLLECDKKYKIGYTRKSVEDRVKQLRTGNSEEFKIITYFESKWGTKIEARMHRKYRSKKISGEWFQLSEEDVLTFELACKEWHDVLTDIAENSTWVLNKKY